MGRYISTGIVYQYRFSKAEIERQYESNYWRKKPYDDIRQEIINQLFPKIYDSREDEEYLYLCLSDSIRVDDLIATMETYYSLVGMNKEATLEFEGVKEMLKDKTMNEAYDLANEMPSYLYYQSELGFNNSFFAYPLVIEGEKSLYGVDVSIIVIDSSPNKTIAEDDLSPYDFFTELLRYRMKPDKLADAMIIFLSP